MRGQQTLLTIKKLRLGDGKMAQWVNCLLNKHEDLTFISRTHVKKIKKMWWHMPVISTPIGRDTEIPADHWPASLV